MEVHSPTALIAGLIIGTYWARVLRMVWKIRRRTGRAANFLPPEPIGRLLRVIWYPTVVVWVIHPLVNALTTKPPPPLRRLYSSPVLEWLGILVAISALVATWICWRRMGKSWRMGIDPGEKTQLVVSGPYAYVRHPIYALSSLLMLATVLILPTPTMLIVAAFHLFFLQWEARREEKHLAAVHGTVYDGYVKHVGRFIPRSLRGFDSRRVAGS